MLKHNKFQPLISARDIIKSLYIQTQLNKTAFVTPTGKFELLVMPFGLMGAPAVFQRMMNSTLADMSQFSSAHIDDVAVFSETWEEHLQHLEQVLSNLEKMRLTIKPSKCHLGAKEVLFLGFRIGGGNIRPDKVKIDSITNKTLGRAWDMRANGAC